MGNVNMEASQINYRGGEKKMSVEEALKNTSGEAAAIAQLQNDVLNLNSNKANQITIAPFFSAETAYDPGDLVYYNGLSYRCVNAHEGEWDADDFAATTIAGELDSLKSGLTDLVTVVTGSIASREYAPGASYYALYNVPTGYIPCGVYFTAGEYASQFAAMLADAGTVRVMNVSTLTQTTALSFAVVCVKANS